MISATLLTGALLLGAPSESQTPVLAPTQPLPGDPAIAPAVIDAERAGPEPMPAQPGELPPEPADVADDTALPSWQEQPEGIGDPTAPNPNGPVATDDTDLADWQSTPAFTDVAAPDKQAPPKGWALIGAAGGVYGGMILTQLITGVTCEDDVYCGTRGWGWRAFGLVSMGLAGGGGWLQGKRVAWDRAQAGEPAKNPVGRRAAGWTMFALGVAGMLTDATLYQLCYDGRRGPYIEIEGFRYTCSPVISVVTLDLSTLVGATGLGLALSAESQLRNRPKFDLSVAPWAGRGQAGLSVAGRF